MTRMSTTEPEYLDLHEVPPAGSGKIQDYDSSGFLRNVRYWLIKKLAGKCMVIINAHVAVIPRIEDRNVIGRATQTGAGMYITSSYLWCDDERMLLLSNRRHFSK